MKPNIIRGGSGSLRKRGLLSVATTFTEEEKSSLRRAAAALDIAIAHYVRAAVLSQLTQTSLAYQVSEIKKSEGPRCRYRRTAAEQEENA